MPQVPCLRAKRRGTLRATLLAAKCGGALADPLEEFQKFRAGVNEEILGCGRLGRERFFTLDHQTYEPGALDANPTELLGLVASTVLALPRLHHLSPGEVRGGGVGADEGDRWA